MKMSSSLHHHNMKQDQRFSLTDPEQERNKLQGKARAHCSYKAEIKGEAMKERNPESKAFIGAHGIFRFSTGSFTTWV